LEEGLENSVSLQMKVLSSIRCTAQVIRRVLLLPNSIQENILRITLDPITRHCLGLEKTNSKTLLYSKKIKKMILKKECKSTWKRCKRPKMVKIKET
jgi:hypothetical protein